MSIIQELETDATPSPLDVFAEIKQRQKIKEAVKAYLCEDVGSLF